jgi:A/G-specific adenine glycosylase
MASRDDLLAWYDRHRRELPWRRNAEPYRVWLSEVMLQQTRVETALPYYERFLQRFPDVTVLAAAPIEEVLALWSGLGYYRRARQLHEAAHRIARDGFPVTAAEWRELPGIGEYTAAAVASIAFGETTPVVDGNVLRVTARLLALAEDPQRAASRQRLRAAAADLLDPDRPGDSNQALMELGALICTPRTPKCLLCPLASRCEARRLGAPERFPRARERPAPKRLERVVAVVEVGGRRLLFRRDQAEALLAGLWELPWTGEEEGAVDPAKTLGRRYGGRWRLGERLGAVRHGITHRAYVLEVFRAEVEGSGELGEGRQAGWFSAEEAAALPTSSMVAKVLKLPRPRPG